MVVKVFRKALRVSLHGVVEVFLSGIVGVSIVKEN